MSRQNLSFLFLVSLFSFTMIAVTPALAGPVPTPTATPTPSAAPAAKLQICHVPPGNSDNFHTITISQNTRSAHLAHGDPDGPCDEHCQTLCDDGNACTKAECDPSGGCAPADPVNCDDRNLCTTDTCDPDSGCGNAPVVCDAPDLCTVGMCASDTGECVNSPVACAEGHACNLDSGQCEDTRPPCPCADLWDNGVGAPALRHISLRNATCVLVDTASDKTALADSFEGVFYAIDNRNKPSMVEWRCVDDGLRGTDWGFVRNTMPVNLKPAYGC